MKTIGIVTSGGDAPGMNAAIRAVTRIAAYNGMSVIGFERGWEGLISGLVRPLNARSVSGIINMGGTILHTTRCPHIQTSEGRAKAAACLAKHKVDGLVVIGGDGSFRAARALGEKIDTLMVGVPATIDNDVYGTDETIGFDTAVDTAIGMVDKIRDTAISHERMFIVEVMGRKRGFLASMVGLTVGAEIILVPEVPFKEQRLFDIIRANESMGKRSAIIIAAEGIGDTRKLALDIEENTGLETRLSVLGYAQRGGSPTARSRYLASEFGSKAVELLSDDKGGLITTLREGRVMSFSLEESVRTEKPLDPAILKLAEILAT
ncbi:6-phosphofructokinase [Methanocella paludicola SANAE]|uniref:6-phosphofructokinase n=1 Tax=Methanocella paludicola (strain DSM 17711 / JCM 13418 / NBRC 101707 / SANAE) TaxID=304371 RepID=D1YY62_METPS|nr:ATP-dependent 6-phosphofructokinase [Methanocella paludicola]BAI61384.1 6-phosphofructokinase [Methanocella paludicola SANAE]